MPASSETLVFTGSNFLRQRLLLSALSGRSVRVTEIRSGAAEPGLREYEVGLVRLLDKITNGTKVELNETGTALFFQPGILIGGSITHDCCTQRGIGYYLEVLLAVGPFCKQPISAVLRGVTHTDLDSSVDKIKAAALPILLKFILVDDGLEVKIVRRGAAPLGGGEVVFKCPVRRQLRPLQWCSWGLVKRVRGVVYALRVSPTIANRIVESAKGVMLKFLPDVYINTDQCRGANAGRSPGYGICLIAETDQGTFYCAEAKSNEKTEELKSPEELGEECARRLLDEVYRGGAVDSSLQWLVALWMALGQRHVAECLVGPLSEYTIKFLQHMKHFFGLMFKLDAVRPNGSDEEDEAVSDSDEEGDGAGRGASKVKLTCVGIGYVNVARKVL